MSLQRISFPDRESWLEGRSRQGLGASEVAAACGMSPWTTRNELWEVKVGVRKPKDIAGNAEVRRGTNMEGAVRDFFIALHPEYSVEHHPFDILYQSERPFLFATLDGELLDGDGRKGILEIKTAAPNGKSEWAKWDGRAPDHYYLQTLGQLMATGYSFVVLQAALWSRNGDITLKDPLLIERDEHREDLAWVLQQVTEFWTCVLTGKRPGLTIRF